MNRADVARGFGWNLFFNLLNRAIFPVLGIVLARILGPEEMGIYTLLVTVLTVTDVFREAGIGSTFISDQDGEHRRGAYHTLAIVTALGPALVVLFARDWIAGFLHQPKLSWGLAMMAVAILVNGVSVIPSSTLQRELRFKGLGATETVASLASFAVAFALVLRGSGFIGLVWQLLTKNILFSAMCMLQTRTWPAKCDLPFAKRVFRKSAWVLLNDVLYAGYALGDQLLIGRVFKNPVANGNYGVAKNLASKPLDFLSFPLSRTLFVAYARSANDERRFAEVFYRSITAAAIVTIPLFTFVGIFSRPIILALYTAKFAGAIPLLATMSVYYAFRSIGTLAGSALVASGRPRYTVLPWLAAYAVAGAGIGWNYHHLTLEMTVGWLTAGAAAVYSLYFVMAYRLFPPAKKDLQKVGVGVLAILLTTAATLAFSLLPLRSMPLFLVGLVVVPLAHMAVLGKLFVGTPAACFRRGGVKEVWRAL